MVLMIKRRRRAPCPLNLYRYW